MNVRTAAEGRRAPGCTIWMGIGGGSYFASTTQRAPALTCSTT
jgi:hypothetical protein